MYILVTGGAGYIGSHTVVELINHGYKVVIADNLYNSSYDAVARIEFIVKQHVPFFNVDIRDKEQLSKIFETYEISSVIHFAAMKAVGESTKIPLKYYDNNVNGTIRLLEVMDQYNVKNIVFSLSATVYGDVTRFGDNSMIPIPEHCPNDPTNPYGKTKYVIENILHDVYNSDKKWKTAILRYFNPIGAHPSGLIGEDPLGIPQNLLPYLSQVAIGRREKLSIFGNDYNSHDGTPIRDYIHVIDLAKGHIAALEYLHNLQKDQGLFREWNLGSGKGSTVFDVYHAFCKVVGRELPHEVVGRRDGDVLDLTANPKRANEELKWKTHLTIDDACRDLWKWTVDNPSGYNIDNYLWKALSAKDLTNRSHTIKVDDSFKVSIMNLGATVQNVTYKDAPVAIGFATEEEYKNQLFYIGATVGRYANRISDAEKLKLSANENGNTLHGGKFGFDKKNFLGPVVKRNKKENSTTVEFYLLDPHLENGFPGDLGTLVKYTIAKGSIEIEYESELLGKADETFLNLTNHSYWNISTGSSIDGTEIKMATSKALEVDPKSLLPTGKFVEREVTGFAKGSEGIDTCFVLEQQSALIDTRSNELKTVLEATHPDSRVKLVVQTTEPSFQLYTADHLNIPGKFGPRGGFCVESGRYIDAINQDSWKKLVILQKGETYGSKTKYAFESV